MDSGTFPILDDLPLDLPANAATDGESAVPFHIGYTAKGVWELMRPAQVGWQSACPAHRWRSCPSRSRDGVAHSARQDNPAGNDTERRS